VPRRPLVSHEQRHRCIARQREIASLRRAIVGNEHDLAQLAALAPRLAEVRRQQIRSEVRGGEPGRHRRLDGDEHPAFAAIMPKPRRRARRLPRADRERGTEAAPSDRDQREQRHGPPE
jgi:hypothetical protein